jgi:hypothetical protein
MSRDSVNEGSACTIRVRCYDSDDTNVVPLSLRYRLRDLTNERTIIDWTNLAPALFVDVVVEAESNAIYSDINLSEEHVLSVQANYDDPNQFARDFRYVVMNLQGFT